MQNEKPNHEKDEDEVTLAKDILDELIADVEAEDGDKEPSSDQACEDATGASE